MDWPPAAVRIATIATVLATGPLAAQTVPYDLEPTRPDQSVLVRDVLDGSGPSHVIARGRALILFDPNEGLVRRYSLNADDQISDAPTACAMPREFSPRYVLPLEHGLLVEGEDPKPVATPSNARLPVIVIADGTLAHMAAYRPRREVESCSKVEEDRSTPIPVESRLGLHGGFIVSPTPGTPIPSRGAILVGPDKGAELFNVRAIGQADNFGPAVLRRELVGGAPER